MYEYSVEARQRHKKKGVMFGQVACGQSESVWGGTLSGGAPSRQYDKDGGSMFRRLQIMTDPSDGVETVGDGAAARTTKSGPRAAPRVCQQQGTTINYSL